MDVSGSKIVIVDDMRVNIEILKKRLLVDKYEVISFNSSLECHQKLGEIVADVFILDIEMPEMNGIELAKLIHAHPLHSNVPILFFTGADGDKILAEAFGSGGVDFIPKETSETELRLRIRSAIQLFRAQENQKRQAEMLEIYLRLIFHDLSNPLTVCKFNLDRALKSLPPSKETQYLEKTSRSLNRIMDLTSDLKSFFQGSETSNLCTPSQICEDLNFLFEDRIEEKSIKFTTKFSIDQNLIINIPRTFMVHQIASNFISNAIKFSDQNSEIEIQFEPASEISALTQIVLKIVDHGQGMSPEALEAFAQKRQRESTTGTSGEKGTGSGVLIAQFFLEKFKGSLKIESKLKSENESNFGTTINLYLPIKKAA